MDILPEPTADTEPETSSMPVPELTLEHKIAPEPEHMIAPEPEHKIAPEPEPELNSMSDQMREQATLSTPVGVVVEFERMDWRPAHTPTAESELSLASVKFFENLKEDIPQSLSSGPAQLQVSWVSAGPAQLQISFICDGPTQLPSSASSN